MSESYVTLNELSEKLKLSRATIDRWRKEGLPFVKIGNGVRFIESDVMKWIQKNKQK
jgi:excisionase family DNA binding protein